MAWWDSSDYYATSYDDPALWADQGQSYDQPGWGSWTDPDAWGTDLSSDYAPSYEQAYSEPQSSDWGAWSWSDYGQPTQTMPDVAAFEQGGPPVGSPPATPWQTQPTDLGEIAAGPGYEMGGAGSEPVPGWMNLPGVGPAPSPPMTPDAPTGESWIDKAIRLAGSPAAGTLVRGALGAGGVGLVGAGLATKTPTLKVPPRTLNLSPQEQAAASAMSVARAKASGTISDRGYAGEEGIRQEVNKKIQAALTGNYDQVSPYTVRRVEDARRQLYDRLRAELGTGFFTSTAGQNAIENFERNARELLQDESDKRLDTLNTMGAQRTGFARQLELDPSTMAQVELSSLAPIAGQQQNLQYQTDLGNLNAALAKKQGLLQTGGLMTGVAAAPYLYRRPA